MTPTKAYYTNFNYDSNSYPYNKESKKIIFKDQSRLTEEEREIFDQENLTFMPLLTQTRYFSTLLKNKTSYKQDFASSISSTKFLKHLFDKESFFLSFGDSSSHRGYNWLPGFKITDLGSFEGLPVISLYSKQLFEQFDNFLITSSSEADTLFYHNNNALSSIYASYDASRSIDSEIIRKEIFVNDSDIKTSYKTLFHSILWNTNESLQTFSTPMKVLKTHSPCSGQVYNFDIEELSAAKLNKGSGAFVPVLMPVSYFSPHSGEYKQAYFFTFYYNLALSKILKYVKSKKYILDFLKNACTNYGTAFFNKSLANKIHNHKLKTYTDQGYPLLIAEALQAGDCTLNFLNHPLPVPAESYSSFFSRKTYPKEFLLSKQRYEAKKERYTSFSDLTKFTDSFAELTSPRVEWLNKQIVFYQKQADSYKEKLSSLKTNQSHACKNLEDFLSSVSTLYNASSELKNLKQELISSESRFAKEAITVPDQSYLNIMQNYEIINIVLSDSSGNRTVYDASNPNFNLDLLSQSLDIYSLTFATKAPSKIKVVGLSNYHVVGGPYVVEVTSNSLKIALKNKTSFFGPVETHQSISGYIHPHTSAINISNIYNRFTSACLGEASSWLYKAFINKDIKNILIVSNLWLTSANKNDVWGRNYKNFIPYADYLEGLNFPAFEDSAFEYPTQTFLTPDPSYQELNSYLPFSQESSSPGITDEPAPPSYSPLVPRNESQN